MEKYYVGLDMGTSSVGWAVTDEKYNLIRRKGKDMWGVRVFPEAQTSAERRSHRTARRRLQREHARIGMLRELFQAEINKVDPGFYQRMEDSKFHIEDKMEYQPYALFKNKDFNDKNFYEKYPTIFHLRKELIESKEPHDVRLVYLAIHNIFKHRGHFLNMNLGDSGINNLKDILSSFLGNYYTYTEDNFADLYVMCDLQDIFTKRACSDSRRCELLAEGCDISRTKDKSKYELIKLMCGLSGTVSVAFPTEIYDEETSKIKLSFKSSTYEEILSKLETMLSETAFEIILDLKSIYDFCILSNIMSGEDVNYLSDARIASYEKHKADLTLLKKVYKEYLPNLYDDMFRVMKAGNYSSYVGSVNSDKKKVRRCSESKNRTSEFMDRIKKDLSKIETNTDVEYILTEIQNNNFLPKQLTGDNGVIPYQLHKSELIKILENAATYIPILNVIDDSGLSVAQRIIAIFEYNIPYFIGPLRNTQNGTGWSEVKGKGKITPWNIEQRIDFQKSEEKFILKMIRHCSYLSGELVLPRESLLYQKYCVLNELNNLKVNGVKISVELKQRIFNYLFKKGKKVTEKKLKEFFVREGIVEKGQDIELSGFDGDFINTLSSYKKFCEVFDVSTLSYEQEKMAEEIISWITIHSGSKKIIKDKINNKYGDILSKEQINRIVGYKFKDWGNLSKVFLETTEKDGEITIISRMWDTNCNLMELLSGNFGYGHAINEKSTVLSQTLEDIEYSDLDDMYLSNPVKRMVWQTLLILKEIVQVMGCEPTKLFVEMTRGGSEEQKGRTNSRQKKLTELYKACKKDEPELFERIKGETDSRLRIRKLYLYYMQKGRCMYTGEPIRIEDLMNDNLYDLDHIYPRHFRKDDSIDNNLVLVKKYINNRKQDIFPIETDIRKTMYSWWKSLYESGFITKIKYERLTRQTAFSPEEKAEFISRQLVETSQGTKAVTRLMEKIFGDNKVIYVKASTVSQFRQQKDMIKVRSINDLHHANDAYLNIVVGNVYNVKFTKNPMNFIREYEKNPTQNKYHLEHMFDYDVRRGSEVAWIIKGNASLDIVRKTMGRGTPLVTYMNYEAHGGITNKDTIYSADKATLESYMPVSTSDSRLADVTKYGGRMGMVGTYFFLVEHTEKNKRIRTLEPMYLYMVDKLKTREDIEEYCMQELGYVDPSVRLGKIKMYSKICVNGYDLLLTGRSSNKLVVSNAMQLKLSNNDSLYIKKIESVLNSNLSSVQIIYSGVTSEDNIQLYNLLTDKHLNGIFSKKPNPIGDKLNAHKEDFIKLSLVEQCNVISEIIKATRKENTGANLSVFHEAAATGKITLNKKLSNYFDVEIINQSITGLYESRVNLLTV